MRSPVAIPLDRLSAEALEGLIAEFVTRDGTDYGLQEHTLQQKMRSVRRQLQRGDVVIVFDPESETCTLLHKDALPRG